MLELNFAIIFFYGFIVGLSPCILLMLSSFGTSLLLTEKKSDFFQILLGLVLGMISAYVAISILFLPFAELLAVYNFTKFIFAGILISLGIWQILESQKEKSVMFGTPLKVKLVLKGFIEKRTGFYSFLVGVLLTLIKIPCFGSVYLALLYSLQDNPMLIIYIIVYLIAMVLPVIIILSVFRLGLESSKFNDFRLKYRPYLRIVSGSVLIFLAFYLLFF